jgi:hypothetical protein
MRMKRHAINRYPPEKGHPEPVEEPAESLPKESMPDEGHDARNGPPAHGNEPTGE